MIKSKQDILNCYHEDIMIYSDKEILIFGYISTEYPEILRVILWKPKTTECFIDADNYKELDGSNVMSDSQRQLFNNKIKMINPKKSLYEYYLYLDDSYKYNKEMKDKYKDKINSLRKIFS